MKPFKMLVSVMILGIFVFPQMETIYAADTVVYNNVENGVAVSNNELPQQESVETQEAITPFTNMTDLKAQIEAATTDITINLDPGIYEFDSQITNTLSIKVTLVGATDVDGKPATQFTMATTVTGTPRFLRVDAGSLEISNVNVFGTKGINGGVSARNIIATNCVFENNFTSDGVSGGGAIRANGGTLEIENSIFRGNSVTPTSDGGAVSSQYGGNVSINNSIFENNEHIGNNNQYGGAISIKQPSIANTKIEITNSSFIDNTLTATGTMTKGGAIGIYSSPQVSSVEIDNVLFKGNRNTSRNGGAVAFNTMSTKSTVSNCTFMDNTTALYGGAVYYENSNGDNKIVNSTFVGNSALSGPAVAAYSSSVKLESSTFISNVFSTQGTGSLISVENSIVAGTAAYSSATISYIGTNLARKIAGDPVVDANSVFTAYTSGTLKKISEHNYVAPIIIGGPAFEKINTPTRLLFTSQNGVARKTPYSDIGAFEAQSNFILNFNLNGGDGSAPSNQTIDYGALATAPTDPTRQGYTFSGWNTAQDGTGSLWNFATQTMPANDVTLYAQWEISAYQLQFNLNGGDGIAPSDQTIDYGALATAPTNPTRQGYTFNGWNTVQDGTGMLWNFATQTMPANDVTLYAQWEISAYQLQFNLNGGDGIAPSNQTIGYGALATAPTNPTRQGYTFNGWNTVQDGTGMLWDFATQTMPANDVTLFAQWEISANQLQFNLQFNLNGGEGIAPSNQTIDYGALATVPTDPIRQGYTFKGWNTVQDGTGILWNFATQTMPANDVTLYAQWENNAYQLQFNLNGGEGIAPSNQTIDYGALATAPADPMRQGYTFKGWNTVQDGTGILWNFATQTMPANDVTLYAQWETNSGPVLPKTGQETNAFLIGLLSVLSGSSLIILNGIKKKIIKKKRY